MIEQQRPFRFGVQLCQATSAANWIDQVQRAEALGYDVVLIPDHFGDLLAYGPAIGVAAAATSRLRFGTLVLQNPLRHPAIVAAEAASLDLLSDGRFELGLGAGGSEMDDYAWTGMPFEAPAIRVGQLEESVQIIKALFSGETATFHGQHYAITDMPGYPASVRRPHPPILIGAGGTRLLRFAARHAGIVSMLPKLLPIGGAFENDELCADAFLRKVELVREAAGDRFGHIEFNTLVQRFVITDDPMTVADQTSERWTISPGEVLDSPYALIGPHERIIELLQARRERFGLSYYVVFDRHIEEFAPIVAELAGR